MEKSVGLFLSGASRRRNRATTRSPLLLRCVSVLTRRPTWMCSIYFPERHFSARSFPVKLKRGDGFAEGSRDQCHDLISFTIIGAPNAHDTSCCWSAILSRGTLTSYPPVCHASSTFFAHCCHRPLSHFSFQAVRDANDLLRVRTDSMRHVKVFGVFFAGPRGFKPTSPSPFVPVNLFSGHYLFTH